MYRSRSEPRPLSIGTVLSLDRRTVFLVAEAVIGQLSSQRGGHSAVILRPNYRFRPKTGALSFHRRLPAGWSAFLRSATPAPFPLEISRKRGPSPDWETLTSVLLGGKKGAAPEIIRCGRRTILDGRQITTVCDRGLAAPFRTLSGRRRRGRAVSPPSSRSNFAPGSSRVVQVGSNREDSSFLRPLSRAVATSPAGRWAGEIGRTLPSVLESLFVSP